jgi:hypothetical protein
MLIKNSSFSVALGFIAVFCAVYLWSVFIFDYYITGDQIIYTRFYREAVGLDFAETWFLQQGLLGSGEPGFALIVSLASQYFTKVEFMSLSNGLLGALLFLSVKDRRTAWLIFVVIIFNYYISVLFFSSERLKFAVILALIILNMRESNLKNALLLLPTLFHFQYILMIPVIFIGLYQKELNRLIINLSFRFSLAKTFVVCCVMLGTIILLSRFSEPLVAKFLAYAGRTDLYDLLRVILMSGFLVSVSRFKIISMLVALYFIFWVAVLGSERIIIMEVAYIFALIRLTDMYKATAFLLIGAYFMFKTGQFYMYISACGHGFLCK